MRFLNGFICEAGGELLKAFRAPEFILPTLVMPVAFYALFAIALPGSNQAAPSLLATFGVFAVMGPAVFGFGAGVASEREQGWLTIKRAAPTYAFSYIGAKLYATLFFAFLSLILVYLVAGFGAGVTLPKTSWVVLLGVHLLCVVPFVLIGLTLGFLFNANGAVAIANIVFLSLSVVGGLWVPISFMPEFIQTIAHYVPSFHLGEIALKIVGYGDLDWMIIDQLAQHVYAVSIMTIILLIVTIFAWAQQRR